MPRRPLENPGHQRESRRWFVANGRDLRLSASERAFVLAHPREVISRRASPNEAAGRAHERAQVRNPPAASLFE